MMLEINRQAQAIGLINGRFARSLSVFVGGGRENGGTSRSRTAASAWT